MEDNKNIEILRQLYQNVKQGNIKEVLNHLSDRIQMIMPGAPQVPWGGNYNNKQDAERFYNNLRENLEYSTLEPNQFIPYQNQVIVFGKTVAKVRRTGKEYTTDWCMRFEFDNDKIKFHQVFQDTALIINALK